MLAVFVVFSCSWEICHPFQIPFLRPSSRVDGLIASIAESFTVNVKMMLRNHADDVLRMLAPPLIVDEAEGGFEGFHFERAASMASA